MPSSIHWVVQNKTCVSSLIPPISVSPKFNFIMMPCGLYFQTLFVSLWYLPVSTALALVQVILIFLWPQEKLLTAIPASVLALSPVPFVHNILSDTALFRPRNLLFWQSGMLFFHFALHSWVNRAPQRLWALVV